jgi:hypothetical protein
VRYSVVFKNKRLTGGRGNYSYAENLRMSTFWWNLIYYRGSFECPKDVSDRIGARDGSPPSALFAHNNFVTASQLSIPVIHVVFASVEQYALLINKYKPD